MFLVVGSGHEATGDPVWPVRGVAGQGSGVFQLDDLELAVEKGRVVRDCLQLDELAVDLVLVQSGLDAGF